ncbi:MAG: hypothetical protein H7Y20_10685, partial [Bryobacteraceae bacterium]|nr:hypothetical protein [Bryobacteraceae bacterium]
MIRLSGISERWRVAWASLGLVWLFFIEYLPPFRNTKFWSDIEGYHHPLLNYTHKSIRAGRLPEWDPTIYSGMPFAGNIQAAVFYPPNWILHLAHLGYDGIRFLSIEILAIFHVWLAFFFGYLWLRERSRHWIPAVLGGSVIAFGGYLLSQMNHLGVGCGYAWIPLGMWGIEQASRQQSWRPLWKLAIASAMCFLAGYPANWAAFALVAVAFAIASPGYLKLAMQSVSALVFSLLLSAVALFPSIEAARMKTPEQVFGGGLMEAPGIWLSYLLPNFYDQ